MHSDRLINPTLLTEGSHPGDKALLRASKCEECGRTEFPAHSTCPACTALSTEVTLGPSARLVSFTEVLHQPPGADMDVPYTIVVAGFDGDNLAVIGVLDHHVSTDQLEVGQRLEACVVATGSASTFGFTLA